MSDNGQASQSNLTTYVWLTWAWMWQIKTRHAYSIAKTLQNHGSDNKGLLHKASYRLCVLGMYMLQY